MRSLAMGHDLQHLEFMQVELGPANYVVLRKVVRKSVVQKEGTTEVQTRGTLV
jgi:hypothetical protein